jgi:hypothetical protein
VYEGQHNTPSGQSWCAGPGCNLPGKCFSRQGGSFGDRFTRQTASGVGNEGLDGVPSREAFEDTSHFDAARIQHLAAPNTVVISAATQRLVQGYFTCIDLGTP